MEGFAEKPWKDIRVGSIVKVKDGELFPCDLLVISSKGKDGFLYVSTKSLDGETNLKLKKAHVDFYDKVLPITGTLKCEPPNNQLY